MATRTAAAGRGFGWRLWALLPVLLLALAVAAYVASGTSLVRLIGTNPPPADEFDVRRVEFHPGEIKVRVTNPQTDDLTIASVTVDDAIVPFELDGPQTLGRLRSSTIVIPYRWVVDDPIAIGVTSSTGIETVEEIPAAVETPGLDGDSVFGYAIIGFLVGILPVALGLLWLPSLRRAEQQLADGVHGADGRPALVSRRRGACSRRSSCRRRSRARSAGRGSCCSGLRSAT